MYHKKQITITTEERVVKVENIISELEISLNKLIEINTGSDSLYVDRYLINKLQCLIFSEDENTDTLVKWKNSLKAKLKKETD